MGKTLGKIIFGLGLAVGALSLLGCPAKDIIDNAVKTATGEEDAYKKALKITQDTLSAYTGDAVKQEVKANREDEFEVYDLITPSNIKKNSSVPKENRSNLASSSTLKENNPVSIQKAISPPKENSSASANRNLVNIVKQEKISSEDYFLNKQELENFIFISGHEGLEEWMKKSEIVGYEIRQYRFNLENTWGEKTMSWNGISLVLFTYAKEKEKKVYPYTFSPFNDYGFILDNNKFAYFQFVNNNSKEQVQAYAKMLVSYYNRHKAKLFFRDVQNISPEEYMKRLTNFTKEYIKDKPLWNVDGREIEKELLKK